MKLRVITWNLRRRACEGIWNYFEQDSIPTIALLQETRPSPASNDTYVCHQIEARRWGTAVLTSGLQLTEVQLKHYSHPGTVVMAKVALPDWGELSVISLYGQMQDGNSITTLHRILSDLTQHLDNKKKSLVLGGDFNASTQWDEQHAANSHRIFFNRLENFGLMDCLARFHTGYIQTWRSPRQGKIRWQLDYIYTSHNVGKKLVSCDVIDTPDIRSFSDHNPVAAVFDL
jgi:endonuclease/exonuclease/phosphatase family metal-dependent hydrolase